MLKERVFETISSQLKSRDFVLLTPKQAEFGDYAVHIHQIHAINPSLKANDFVNSLFENVEERGGFLNFFIKQEYLLEEVNQMIGENKMSNNFLEHKKVMVEFTDPNPFKEFHVGHLLDNIIGESLARLIAFHGAEVKRANYEGDVGMHVAKSVWGMIQLSKDIPPQGVSPIEKAQFLGKAYAFGASRFAEDEIAKDEITVINKKIYDQDPEILEMYHTGRSWSLEYFELIYKRLGTKFDYYFFESEISKDGVEIVREYLKKGIFKESEGAIVFPGEDYGLHTRVFINSLGLPTYEAKELGLAPKKYEKFPYDISLILTGNEVKEYFKVLLCALEKIRPDLASKTHHLTHGMVKNADGSKMSSRFGNVLTGEELLNEAKHLAMDIIEQTPNDFSDEEKGIVAEAIGKGAIKYAFLSSAIGKDILFDMKQSVSFHGNSGPYLQYTYARCMSILRKSEVHISSLSTMSISMKEMEEEEKMLLQAFVKFPEVLYEATEKYAPHLVCTYLFSLTQRFNTFYEKLPILKAEGEKKNARLYFTYSVATILKTGLELLGIEVLEKI